MSRFVIVSFATLGWVFYELSGGADFVPPAAPPRADPIASAPIASVAKPTSRDITVSASSLVTKTSLVPETVLAQRHRDLAVARNSTTEPANPAPTPLAETDPAPYPQKEAPGQQGTASLFAAGLGEGGLQLASLEAGLQGGLLPDIAMPAEAHPDTRPPETTGDAAAPDDLRTIRAARVNMRQGPGTDYPIITRLLTGDKVIVVDDNGAGWLLLRTVDAPHFGWIAASLVSEKAP